MPEGLVVLRAERPADSAAVREVVEDAFRRPDEANLIDALRTEDAIVSSLVAEADGRIVGHILFSRIWIETDQDSVAALALAPIAVLRSHQNRHIGSQLVRVGLAELKQCGERIVIVLGHPEYYERFGFSVGKAGNLVSPFPPEAFMAVELVDRALEGIRGSVRYAAAFRL